MDLQDLLVGLLQVPNKQWGYYVESQNPTDYRYWSIPFTSHYITMATKTYYEPKEEAVPWLVGIDMQKFICGYGANFIGSSYVSCVGIGCQLQWGKILGDTVNLKIINFPVSFNECFGGLALFNGDPVAAAEYATITDITNTNFKIYMYANNAGTGYTNANIFYLFLGAQQQWRKDPGLWAIPFTTFVAGGITMTRSGWQGSGEWNGDSGTVSLTGYSAQCATGNSVSNIGGSAIAIGQQL